MRAREREIRKLVGMDIEETRKGKKEKILMRERERTHGRRRGDSNFDGGEEIQILLV